MKFFNSFDTKARQRIKQEYIEKYGNENVMCFGRSKLYWFIKIFFPILFLFLFGGLVVLVYYYIFDGDSIYWFSLGVFVLVLIFSSPIAGKRIDYKMDFIVVTPNNLIMYDQKGFLNKKVITLNEKSIKTISVERSGFLYSIFNNGDIIVLSEGDMDHGEITLKWIPRPEKRKRQITKIFEKDFE